MNYNVLNYNININKQKDPANKCQHFCLLLRDTFIRHSTNTSKFKYNYRIILFPFS